jgi:hypothetical protein
MTKKNYVGMDVHKATTSVAVRDSSGKLTMESVIETKNGRFWDSPAALAETYR